MAKEVISMTLAQLEEMQKRAAEDGARLALAAIGLEDEKAVEDIRDIRDLMNAYRQARAIIWHTIVKYITMFMLGIISYGVYNKIHN